MRVRKMKGGREGGSEGRKEEKKEASEHSMVRRRLRIEERKGREANADGSKKRRKMGRERREGGRKGEGEGRRGDLEDLRGQKPTGRGDACQLHKALGGLHLKAWREEKEGKLAKRKGERQPQGNGAHGEDRGRDESR
jgi:hypothetical protein